MKSFYYDLLNIKIKKYFCNTWHNPHNSHLYFLCVIVYIVANWYIIVIYTIKCILHYPQNGTCLIIKKINVPGSFNLTDKYNNNMILNSYSRKWYLGRVFIGFEYSNGRMCHWQMLSWSFTRCADNMRRGSKTWMWVGLFVLARREMSTEIWRWEEIFNLFGKKMKSQDRSQDPNDLVFCQESCYKPTSRV